MSKMFSTRPWTFAALFISLLAPRAWTQEDKVRADLRLLVGKQEEYFAKNKTYSFQADSLLSPRKAAGKLKIIEATKDGWAGQETIPGNEKASCVIVVRKVARTVKTEGGRAPMFPGKVVCDGDRDS